VLPDLGRDHDGSRDSRYGACDEPGEIGFPYNHIAMEGDAGGFV
jgi:hypothetical protein